MPITSAIAVPHPPLAIPEIGKGLERGIQKTIDSFLEASEFIANQNPETVVIISPHSELLYDRYFISPGENTIGDFAEFGYPNIRLAAYYDSQLAGYIAAEATRIKIQTNLSTGVDCELDHGTMIPLYFLQKFLPHCKIVRIGLSCLSLEEHYEFGKCIARVVGEKKVAIIGSGDLSHRLKDDGPYGFAPEGPELDKQIISAFEEGDLRKLLEIDPELAEKGGECGLRAFAMMAGALDGLIIRSELLSYEGPYGVGYSVATFRSYGKIRSDEDINKDRISKEDEWVSLARKTIEKYINERKTLKVTDGLSSELIDKKAGVFVSLHRVGELRGCIGTIEATTNCVAEEIIQNAISAAFSDPRFAPISKDEIPFLEINVDVLGDAEEIQSPDELDVKRYGVIVSNGRRKGLLLPDLDGVDTVEDQISIARQKAGIAVDEPIELKRFEVIRHE